MTKITTGYTLFAQEGHVKWSVHKKHKEVDQKQLIFKIL